ncbi:GNAT family N-acetyltransferase [Paludisphaera sp.]|uniref:GNAT family N-acetyltransferase n=1 Tax=Paludisphaera sp. TaxID=2017432 RepID=UPI00301E3BF4
MASSDLQIERCPEQDRAPAMEIVYRDLGRRMREALAKEAFADHRAGRVDLSGLWVARRGAGGKLVGAILTQALAGRATALWPPRTTAIWDRAEVAATLVRGTLEGLREGGVAIAQAVLHAAADPRGAADLARGGMPHVTDLIYLRRPTAAPPPSRPATVRFDWRGVDEAGDRALRDVLKATYAGSLDMPEIEGARSLDDVLEGHQGAPGHRPGLWRVGTVPGEPDAAAVLLMAATPGRDAWEVIYLGLTPAARGRGLGVQAVAHALELARPEAAAVELAVDARNTPAAKLYRATGFVPIDRRAVHLAVLSRRGGESAS